MIREAFVPVLRDLRASDAIVPDVREEAHDDGAGEAVSAWVTSDDGSGMGVWVSLAGSPAERVAQLCWAGRSATWPECPEHPGSHPLKPAVAGGIAVWRCPRSQRVAGTIGGLELPAAWTYGAAPARRRAAVTS